MKKVTTLESLKLYSCKGVDDTIKLTALHSLKLNPCSKCGEDCNLHFHQNRFDHPLELENSYFAKCGFCGHQVGHGNDSSYYTGNENGTRKEIRKKWNNEESYNGVTYA